MKIPGDAIYAAAVAMAQVETGDDGVTDPNDIDFILARIALEAAKPYMLGVGWAACAIEAEESGLVGGIDGRILTNRNPYKASRSIEVRGAIGMGCPWCPRLHETNEPCVEATPFPVLMDETYNPTANHAHPPDGAGEWFYACESCSGIPDGDRQ